VRRRPRKGRTATMRDYARVKFEPWTYKSDKDRSVLRIKLPGKLQFCGQSALIAHAIMQKTKDELAKCYDAPGAYKIIDQTLGRIAEASEMLKEIVALLDGAFVRLLVAGSAREIAKNKKRVWRSDGARSPPGRRRQRDNGQQFGYNLGPSELRGRSRLEGNAGIPEGGQAGSDQRGAG